MRTLVHLGAFVAAACLLTMPAAASAQESAAAHEPAITALIEDIEAGRRGAAIARIASVETLTGLPRLVKTGTELMDRMRGCKLASRKPGALNRPGGSFNMERTEWSCGGETYAVDFAVESGKPYVTVAEFSDPTRLAERATRPALPPPVPFVPARNLSPEEIAQREEAALVQQESRVRVLTAFGDAVKAGSLEALAANVEADARFTYGWRDPFNGVNFNEQDGEGLAAGQAQVAAARQSLGAPASASCQPDGPLNVCRWTYGGTPRSLIAFLFFRGDTLRTVQFLYTTQETIEKAAKNATPEQIQAYVAKLKEGN